MTSMDWIRLSYIIINVIGLGAGIWSVYDARADYKALDHAANGKRLLLRRNLRATTLRGIQFILLLVFALIVIYAPQSTQRQVITIVCLMGVSVLMTVSAVFDVIAKRRLLEYIERQLRDDAMAKALDLEEHPSHKDDDSGFFRDLGKD
jgi:hypothetical protein